MNWQHFLLGTAIGDAFGAGVEFQDRAWIRATVNFSTFVNARAQIAVPEEQRNLFTQYYNAWDYTDDTEMTIGVCKALLAATTFSEALLLRCWEEEYQMGITQKGHGRNGHGSMRWYYEGEKSIAEIRAFQRQRPNPGNAPAMRAAPLGLVPAQHINAYAAINARATHPNPNAILASQCIARAAEYFLVLQGNPAGLIDYCVQTVALNAEYHRYLEAVAQLPAYSDLQDAHFDMLCGSQPIQAPYFLPGIRGLPSDSKYTTGAILYILQQAKTPFEGLQQAVYLGGDVDSVASVVTGILCAQMGLDSLPDFMLKQVEGASYMRQLGQRLNACFN
jgi:ADP-ribosylglycohydrolase